MKQNIYDNPEFFSKYKKLRENKYSANNLEEKPELFEMLPDTSNKRVLDLGCGYGENCRAYLDRGAREVVGIDISQKMIAVANENNSHNKIQFINIDMADILKINQKFDLVVSSLAIHYIYDYPKLCRDVFELVAPGGFFLFSQEHPVFTATKKGITWQKDIEDSVTGMILEDYQESGKRVTHWLIDDVIKYHRTFSDIINPLIDVGFSIDRIKEPKVTEELIQLAPDLSRCRHVPDYLYVKVKKP